MKKLIALLIIANLSFAVISADDAYETAAALKLSDETATTATQIDAYFTIDFKTLSYDGTTKLALIVPVDSVSGQISTVEAVKPIIKADYLNFYFSTSSSNIPLYVSDELDSAENRIANFQNAIDALGIIEAQMPENLTIESISALKSALETGKSSAESVNEKALALSTQISEIDSGSKVATIKSSFSTFFTKKLELINDCEDISTKATAYETELASKKDEIGLDYNTYVSVITNYGLKPSKGFITEKNTLTTNDKAIDSLFDGLDTKAEEYFSNLKDRIRNVNSIDEINRIVSVLMNYSNQTSVIIEKANDKEIPKTYSAFQDNLENFMTLWNESYKFCEGSNLTECEKAKDNYEELESLITEMNVAVTVYSSTSECDTGDTETCISGGKTGTKTCKIDGTWSSCTVESSFLSTSVLIGIGIILILGLLLLLKGNKKSTKPTVQLQGSSRNWQAEQYKF